jgi:GTP-binding protein
MNTPFVAIIGLPNAGKSTFFNKVLRTRKALIHNEAGTTRDRHYGLSSWNGLQFYLVDTAGLNNKPDSDLEKSVQKQTQIAIDQADAIIFFVDGKTELGSEDYSVAQKLTRSKKPILLALNKFDTRGKNSEIKKFEFSKLGLGEPFLISSLNGTGIGDLLDQLISLLQKDFSPEKQEEFHGIKLAFVGKPNVGKSSLINALLKEDRLIVSPVAGTTRSTVDIPFEYEDKKFILLDTAGIKRRWKQDSDIAAAAAFQSIRSIPHADVALLVLDSSDEITVQDQAVASQIIEQNKPVVFLLNKSDILETKQKDSLLDRLPDLFPQLFWAPVVFTSATEKTNLVKILDLALEAYEKERVEVQQEQLDDFLQKMLDEKFPGKIEDQRAPKIYNMKQIGTKPLEFKLTVNFPAAISTGWRRYFEKQLRLKFDLFSTPVVVRYIKRQ